MMPSPKFYIAVCVDKKMFVHLVVVCFCRNLRRPARVRCRLQPPSQREVASGSFKEEVRPHQVQLLVQNRVVRFCSSLRIG